MLVELARAERIELRPAQWPSELSEEERALLPTTEVGTTYYLALVRPTGRTDIEETAP